jgi:RND superfamily putative drug exporter
VSAPRDALLVRVARASGRRPWLFVAVWVVALAALGPLAGQTQSRLSNGGFEVPGSQSERLQAFFNARKDAGSQPFTFLAAAGDASAATVALDDLVRRVRRVHPELVFRADRASSPDGRTRAAFAFAPVDQDRALLLAAALKREVQRPAGALRTFVLGPAATYDTFQHITTSGLARAELIAALPLVVVLLVLFGAVVAASLPLMLAVAAVTITTGVTYLFAVQTEVSIFASTMISMIGIGVAVDYSMFILARFREELEGGAAREEAVVTAMRTSGSAVVFSGITVIVSLLSILLVPVRAIQSMAAAAAGVTLVAVLAAATLLPAVLHLLGPRVNRLRVGRRRAAAAPFWGRWVRGVMARPVRSLIASAGLLLVLAAPALDLRTANTSVEQIPSNDTIRVGSDLLTGQITGPGRGREGVVSVLIRPARGASAAVLAAGAATLAARLGTDPMIERTAIEPHDGALLVVGYLRTDPESEAATLRLVPRVRALAAASPLGREATIDVGGISAFQRDLNEEIGGDLWKVVLFVVVLAYLVLLVLLRSVLLPLKAVVMNLLSIGAAYGVIVAVFQWGWLSFTGLHTLGHVSTLNPPLILAITFGLSMDYEVFLLSRIRERYAVHGSNEEAVAEGITSSARLITSAASIMVIVFGAFLLTGLPSIKEVGAGLAIAIAIDATVTRLVLVPATMCLLGRWNWWLPGWLDRVLPHFAHDTLRAG